MPSPVAAAEHRPQQQRAGDAADELSDDVADRVADAHRAGCEHPDSDRRVHVPTGNAAVRKREDHDGEAMSEGNRGDAGQADTVTDDGGCARADEHECEGTDELRKEFGFKFGHG